VLAVCALWWTDEATVAMKETGYVGLASYFDTCKQQLDALILLVRRRVLGGAGVQLVAGYDPSAPPPLGTREFASGGAFVEDELPDVGGRKPGDWFYC
jgi:hypothetical protein